LESLVRAKNRRSPFCNYSLILGKIFTGKIKLISIVKNIIGDTVKGGRTVFGVN